MSKRGWMAVAPALLLLQLYGAQGEENSYFAARRKAVMKKIEGCAAILHGSVETRAYVPFRQNNDFYYLTGVESPGAFLMIDAVEDRSILFLPPRDRRLEKWEGPRLIAGEEARIVTGVDVVLEVSSLQKELEKRKNSVKHLYTPLRAEEIAATSRDRATQYDASQENNPWDGRVSREKAFERNLRRRLGETVSIRDLSPILDELRRLKDAQEIQRLREASRIGAIGLKEVMRIVEAGQHEYQLAALADFIFRREGAQGQAYFPIVGSGANSCILHYHTNSRKLEPGDIVVMDFGPDYRYYQSDITRTFPVSGVFSQEQRRVYEVVLQAQKAALAEVRPGATFRQINNAARAVLDRAGYGNYWEHGVSHYIGMATHDVGVQKPLEPGVVLTVEPGIYIPEKKLGVRIEDTILVTKDGYENLSKDVPKEIADIERLMSEKGIVGTWVPKSGKPFH